MRVVITKNYDEMSRWAAHFVAEKILEANPTAEKPFKLGCPTGSSPLGMYKELIRLNKAGVISFQNVITFNMDEYVGLPDYEQMIEDAGGIDLFMGGIGPDGHIAFNEPGSSLTSKTRVKTLTTNTLQANCRFFDNDIRKVPKQALTVGVGTVMAAREIIILCSGHTKARALKHAIENGVNHMWTVSMLQMHQHGNIVCDEECCCDLNVSTYQYFTDKQRIEGLVEHYLGMFE